MTKRVLLSLDDPTHVNYNGSQGSLLLRLVLLHGGMHMYDIGYCLTVSKPIYLYIMSHLFVPINLIIQYSYQEFDRCRLPLMSKVFYYLPSEALLFHSKQMVAFAKLTIPTDNATISAITVLGVNKKGGDVLLHTIGCLHSLTQLFYVENSYLMCIQQTRISKGECMIQLLARYFDEKKWSCKHCKSLPPTGYLTKDWCCDCKLAK